MWTQTRSKKFFSQSFKLEQQNNSIWHFSCNWKFKKFLLIDACCSYLSLPHRINKRSLLRLKIHLQFIMLNIIPDDLCSQDILHSDLNVRCSLLRNEILSFKESLSHIRIFCPEVFWEQATPSRANECILTTSLFGRKFC